LVLEQKRLYCSVLKQLTGQYQIPEGLFFGVELFVVGGWWLVVGGWWLVVGGWWLVVVALAMLGVGWVGGGVREPKNPEQH